MTDTAPSMQFHESYGLVSRRTLRLIRAHNVSPADYFLMGEIYGSDWDAINAHITDNVSNGMYRMPLF